MVVIATLLCVTCTSTSSSSIDGAQTQVVQQLVPLDSLDEDDVLHLLRSWKLDALADDFYSHKVWVGKVDCVFVGAVLHSSSCSQTNDCVCCACLDPFTAQRVAWRHLAGCNWWFVLVVR